jgi:hypothetical protein
VKQKTPYIFHYIAVDVNAGNLHKFNGSLYVTLRGFGAGATVVTTKTDSIKNGEVVNVLQKTKVPQGKVTRNVGTLQQYLKGRIFREIRTNQR